MCGVAGDADAVVGVEGCWVVVAVEDGPLVQIVREQAGDVTDGGSPVFKHLFDLRSFGGGGHFLIVGPGVGVGGEGDDVHEGVGCDWEVEDVGAGADVHVLVAGFVRAEGGDGGGHGDEAAVGDFVGVVWVGGWVGGAEEELADAGFDAVAADEGVGGGGGAVVEGEVDWAVWVLGEGVEAFAEFDHACGDDLDELVEEVGAVAAFEASVAGVQFEEEFFFSVVVGRLGEAVDPPKPVVWLVGIAVRCGHCSQCTDDARLDHAHAADGVCGECDPCTDFSKGSCLFVDLDFDVSSDEAQRKDQANDASAHDGDFYGLLVCDAGHIASANVVGFAESDKEKCKCRDGNDRGM